jgi:hypothetical protein
MIRLPLKTAIYDAYPNPTVDVAKEGFGALWDSSYEHTEASEKDLASASTTDIGGQTTTKLKVTGTTTITSLGTNYRGPIYLRFTGALTLTHNATTLILPRGINVTTTAGDTCVFTPKATTSGTIDGWVCSSYPATWSVGNGATGGGGNSIFYENDKIMTASYSITAGKNASMVGPLNINTGVTLTVPTGSRLVIL